MTTTNGHQPHEPLEPVSEEPRSVTPSVAPTSSVLPLDGWGPIAAPSSHDGNGVNGADQSTAPTDESVEETSDAPAIEHVTHRRRIRFPSWESRLISVAAPLLALTVAVWISLRLSSELQAREWRSIVQREPATSTPPSRVDALRRSFALVIDPSLAPQDPPAPWWRRLMDELD